MKSVTSISGGRTSAYSAAKYPTDYNVFALIRTSDIECKFKDDVYRKKVEDKIQKPFVGTLEDDTIVYTIFDLEQFIGKEISWVSDITFDELLQWKKGFLPNREYRYCTQFLKMRPIFYWWAETIGEPVIMNIGYRANEKRRVKAMLEKTNNEGFSEFKATFEKHKNGNNKWEMIAWRKPSFPLFNDGIYKDNVEHYWSDKPVRFATLNNCVGCFHRNPMLLKKQYQEQPIKMNWFESKEIEGEMQFRKDVSYKKIRESELQFELSYDDFTDCDSGYCGI